MKRIIVRSEVTLPDDETWEGFEVGCDDDFAHEVEATGQNVELFKFLAQRRSQGERISLDEVKKQLG